VPTHDEQRVRYSHFNSITCNDLECPGNVRHVDGAKRHIRRHAVGNMRARAAIPAPYAVPVLSRLVLGGRGAGRRPVSALPDPAELRLGRGLR